ncbi:bifunctional DNA-formamidopyrimidine glycosylase/DNA-(apurinic or apyrimidinic site) lyase [Candidatus Saccharibacteria bacterium]|nr:bifunctional DNA-formamidopyrimidine glycosylase/DNA-(apurinic or apyrimidinic site) lyase [Candidatus Saccharibacteria bacterium]
MPELPEVETVKRGLAKLITDKKIIGLAFDFPKSFPNSQSDVDQFMINSTIVSVSRRAKVLRIDLSSDYTLLIHLRMTGQMVFVGRERFGAGHPSDSLIGKLPDRSTRVTITFSDGSRLFFNDQRKFGWMQLMPIVSIDDVKFIKELGPEPLDKSFTAIVLKDRLMRRKNSNIKATLLDQKIIAGIGNIYADEALWSSKIYPKRTVASLTNKEYLMLFNELQSILLLSIKKGGSSDRNYVNAQGKKGSYISFAKVFRREGKSCYRCKDVIQKIRVAGRGTHVCVTCQRIER